MEKTMILVIDGCAPEYLTEKTAPDIFRIAGERGFAKTVESEMPSVTNVNHACILSGLFPEDTRWLETTTTYLKQVKRGS